MKHDIITTHNGINIGREQWLKKGKIKNLIGQKFGKLTVVKYAGHEKRGRSLWLCQCECGNTKVIKAHYLLHNDAKSCGCSQHNKPSVLTDTDKILNIIHQNMKNRCNNPNSDHYQWYGAKGIRVCAEWQHVADFRQWAYSNGYKVGLSIERINVKGNYEPSNCKWIERSKQSYNKTNSFNITYKGETHCLSEWSKILEINYGTLKSRLRELKWSIEKAFTTPVKKKSM